MLIARVRAVSGSAMRFATVERKRERATEWDASSCKILAVNFNQQLAEWIPSAIAAASRRFAELRAVKSVEFGTEGPR